MNPSHPLTARRIAAILAALADGPLTVRAIAARIHLCLDRTSEYVLKLADDGAIHLKTWAPQPTGRQHPVAVYKLGPGKNAPKPARQTGTQRQAAHRARIHADPERLDVFLARGRASKRVKKAVKTPQNPFSALFGVREART